MYAGCRQGKVISAAFVIDCHSPLVFNCNGIRGCRLQICDNYLECDRLLRLVACLCRLVELEEACIVIRSRISRQQTIRDNVRIGCFRANVRIPSASVVILDVKLGVKWACVRSLIGSILYFEVLGCFTEIVFNIW